MPALLVAARRAETLGVFVEAGVAPREAVGQKHAVEIDGRAQAAVVVAAQLGLVGVAKLRALGRGGERAGGISQAEENGVGAAGEREVLGVVAIGRDGWRAEEILADQRRVAAARHILRALGGEKRIAAARGVEDVADIGVGVGREGDEVVDAAGREVVKQALGEDRQGGADVAQRGVETRAVERLGGEISLFGAGGDLKGGELDHFGCGLWGRLRAVQAFGWRGPRRVGVGDALFHRQGSRGGIAADDELSRCHEQIQGFARGQIAAHGVGLHAAHAGRGEHDLALRLFGEAGERLGGVPGGDIETAHRFGCG